MATSNDICGLDAATLAGEIRARQLSLVEVIEAMLGRMDTLEPVLHAFCTPTPDLVRKTAGELDWP